MLRVAVVVVVLAVTLGVFGAARADQRDDARVEFAAGQAADKEHDWQNAIEHYLRAYDLAPHPFALYNIANDYEQLGQLREAARFYKRYVEHAKDDADRDRVDAKLEDLRTRPSKLAVRSQPPGARVSIDGKPSGATPYAGVINGGDHRIVVSTSSDHQDKLVTVEYGEPGEVEVTLHGAAGTLVVTGTPNGAVVEVDGNRAGTLPAAAVTIPSGSHHLKITADGYQTVERDTEVVPVEPTRIDIQLDKEEPKPDHPDRGYFIAGAGGTDARSSANYGNFEFGVRSPRYQILVGVGKQDQALIVSLMFRYALFEHRLSPFIGFGYSYVRPDETQDTTLGGTAEVGVRYDMIRGRKWVLSYRASAQGIVFAAKAPMSFDNEARALFPLSIAIELSFLIGSLKF